MDTTLATGLLCLAATFAAALAMAAWRRLAPRERLRFARMVERSGVALSTLGRPGTLWEVSQAVRTCVRCPHGSRCQAWLDAGQRDGFDAFCPNAGQIRRIARG
ncbi:MAG: DUF6455 family protein [Pseudomonadota bacterium]